MIRESSGAPEPSYPGVIRHSALAASGLEAPERLVGYTWYKVIAWQVTGRGIPRPSVHSVVGVFILATKYGMNLSESRPGRSCVAL